MRRSRQKQRRLISYSPSNNIIENFQPKAFIHWLDVKRSHDAEARLYSQLFKEKDPTSVPGGYIAAANKSSLEVKKIKARC